MRRQLSPALLCIGIVAIAAFTVSAQTGTEYGFRMGTHWATQTDEATGYVASIRVREPRYPVYLNYRDDFEASSIFGPHLSAFVTFPIGSKLSLQFEVIYARRGINVGGSSTTQVRVLAEPDSVTVTYKNRLEQTIEFNCIEIPLLAKVGFLHNRHLRTSVMIGPALTFTSSGSNRYDVQHTASTEGFPDWTLHYDEHWSVNNLRSPDLSVVLGGEIRLTYTSVSLVLDLRYTLGLGNAYKDVGIENTLYNYSDGFPDEFPVAHHWTGKASDAKNRDVSITLGVSFPM